MFTDNIQNLIENPTNFCKENGIHISNDQAKKIQKQLKLLLPNSKDQAPTLLILLS